MQQPNNTSLLARLGELTYRRRRLVVALWVAVLALAVGASAQLAGDWSADYETPGSGSKAAADRLGERFPEQRPYSVDVVWQAEDAVAPATARRVDRLLERVQRLEGIGGDGLTTAQAEVSRDGTVGVVRMPLTAATSDDVPPETGERILQLVDGTGGSGLRVEAAGFVVANAEQTEVSSEGVGLLVAALVLLLTFGSVVAAGMPLATALFGLGISSALVGVLAAVIDVPDWAPSVAAMIGIGVGIDYALLIVTRYRAELAAGLSPERATAKAVATAGRSVLVAGGTVVISLMGLFLMGLTYLHGVALSAILAVLVVMTAAVTLLPALLGFVRHRIDRLAVPGSRRRDARDGRQAARWSRAIQRRPWTATIAAAAVLLALAAPVTGLRLGFPDAGNDAEHTTTRQAYDLMAEGFGAGSAGPLLLVADIDSDRDRSELGSLAEGVAREAGVAAVAEPQYSRRGDTAVLAVQADSAPQDEATAELVRRLRDDVLPEYDLGVDVGGMTASLVDQADVTADRLPLFIGGVVGLSFLLLLAAFRAPVVAVKAAAMNLLSIGAAYGVVALVADGGFFGQLVGIDTATPVPPFIPVMMFAILFGLSMDYEVFLLSRIREEYLARGDTGVAVVEGLARTARVITAAAAIMVAVFGAFVLSADAFVKLIGIGLASAVLIDATLVRMVLVPALMQLLGERNWWLPRWLDRAVPRLEVEPQATRG